MNQPTEPLRQRRSLRSQSLDLLRFPLAVVVVSVHVFSNSSLMLAGRWYNFTDYPLFRELSYLVYGFLKGQSVPIYFFIAGYVFFLCERFDVTTYRHKLRNRFKSLFIPYIIWNLLTIALYAIKQLPVFSGLRATAVSTWQFSWRSFWSAFWMYDGGLTPDGLHVANVHAVFPIDQPLWFLRDLMILALCSPLLYFLLRRFKAGLLWALGIAWMVCDQFYLGYPNAIVTATFFFSWGAYMSINHKDILLYFGKYFKLSLWLYPALAVCCFLLLHIDIRMADFVKSLNVIAGLFFAYNLAAYLIKNSKCHVRQGLAAAGFFIYVAHYLICLRVLKILFILLHPSSGIGACGLFLLTIIVVVIGLLCVFWLLRRFTPRLLKIIAGRK